MIQQLYLFPTGEANRDLKGRQPVGGRWGFTQRRPKEADSFVPQDSFM